MMRPAVYHSLQGEKKPEILTTVFAGQDLEATEKAREYIAFIRDAPHRWHVQDGRARASQARGRLRV